MPKVNAVRYARHANGTVEHEADRSLWEPAGDQISPVNPQPSRLGHDETMQRVDAWRERNEAMVKKARASLAQFLTEIKKNN